MIKLLMGTHVEIREFLMDYLDGRLPWLKSIQFRLHLLLCPSCGDYLRTYNSSLVLARNYLGDPPPDELVELTLKFVEERTARAKQDPEPKPN